MPSPSLCRSGIQRRHVAVDPPVVAEQLVLAVGDEAVKALLARSGRSADRPPGCPRLRLSSASAGRCSRAEVLEAQPLARATARRSSRAFDDHDQRFLRVDGTPQPRAPRPRLSRARRARADSGGASRALDAQQWHNALMPDFLWPGPRDRGVRDASGARRRAGRAGGAPASACAPACASCTQPRCRHTLTHWCSNTPRRYPSAACA